MYVHSSSRFQKLTNTDINNLTYKEARQIANYARTLINNRIRNINKIGLGYVNDDLLHSEIKFDNDLNENYFIYPIPQNEDISFYKKFIKDMKINYEETSIAKARDKAKIIDDFGINITLEKLKHLYKNYGGEVNSSSEIQNLVDNELGGDWDNYWKTYIPQETIKEIIKENTEYKTLKQILNDLY